MSQDYGFWPGRYPAIVRTVNDGTRQVRVEIPGVTDGGDVLPLAEIEYPIGDKSRDGANSTEIEMTDGDTVWVAFIGGDPRYPIITGYRNPQEGNSTGWRRWHHANMELLADQLMNMIAKGDVLIKSDTKITLQAPEIVHDAPMTKATGSVEVAKGLSVLGGGNAESAITGLFKFIGQVFANGKRIDDTHTHSKVKLGEDDSGPVN